MEYSTLVKTLKSPTFDLTKVNQDTVHAVVGIVTEAGELLDALKKVGAYGRELDVVNLKEEVGDVLFYLELLCQSLNTTLELEKKRNMDKLLVRYGDKFSKEKAVDRDLAKERQVLSGQ